MFLGLRQVAREQVRLAEVGVRAAMARIDLQGLVVMQERLVEVARLAIRIRDPVLGVGVAVVRTREVRLQQRDRLVVLPGLDRADGLLVFGVDPRDRVGLAAATAATAAAAAA